MKLQIRRNMMEEVEGLHNEYPYAFHHTDMRETTVPWHWHEALEFGYVVEGSLKISTTTQTLTLKKGEAYFTNSNALITVENVDACILDSHLFHPVFLGGHFKSVFETKYLNPVILNRDIDLLCFRSETDTQRALLGKLLQLSQLQAQPDVEFQTRSLLGEIWQLMLHIIQEADSSIYHAPKNQDRILTMMAFIQENYAEKLTLEQIADAAAISTRECLRCFRESIRQSPMDYLIEYRVQVAKKLLETTSLSITEIALRCGFNSNSYFTKIFRRSCGKTPNAYRKELQSLEKPVISLP
ncbi:MAG: helix-turn-helix transcriptional regulator [Oscillospiraceae bacterium]|nr:helix-turn-helix transcriptional regulator [Oscillospiraceae bacterium]